jgi:hypothetical protein
MMCSDPAGFSDAIVGFANWFKALAMTHLNRVFIFVLILGIGLGPGEWALAQGGGGNQTGGGGGTGQTPTVQPTIPTQNQGGNQQGGDVSMPTSPFQLGDLLTIGQDFSRESVYENNRIQPFVGPSQANVVHPRSQIDPAGSTLGSAGGTGFTFTNSGRNTGQTGRSNTGFNSTGANMNGTEVPRRGVRSALNHTPVFVAPSNVVASQFSGRLSRLPALASAGPVEIAIENRIATLNGIVETAEQGELIARQAELEPGIDRVVNNLQVKQ